jgi:two-component system sensor kinase FixL
LLGWHRKAKRNSSLPPGFGAWQPAADPGCDGYLRKCPARLKLMEPLALDTALAKRLLFIAVAPAYLAVYWLSDVFRLPETGSSPWNPEAGLAVAAVLFYGHRVVPLLVAAHFACLALWAPFSNLAWTLVLSNAHIGTLALIVHLLRGRLTAFEPPTVRSATGFALAALALSVATALVRGGVAIPATDWSSTKIMQVIFTVATGNMVGIITVLPLISGWPEFNQQRGLAQSWDKWTSLLTFLLIAVCIFIFASEAIDQFKFFYLVFLPVIALAIRHGFMGATVATALASSCMIALLLMRQYDDPVSVTELQMLMIVLSLTGLLLGAAVTELKRAFEERLRVHLRWQESQEALGRAAQLSLASEMAAAVAHDIAQPLAATRNYLRSAYRRIQQRKQPERELSRDLKAAVSQIDSAADIIRHTREYLKKGEVQKVPSHVSEIVNFSVELSLPSLNKVGIAIESILPADLPMALANRTQISQVLMNLIRNSKEALVEAAKEAPKILVSANAWERPGFVTIHVADNGPGIDGKVAATLFEPLVSTRAGGLGIGLPLSETIIREHGGTIWLDESSAKGAKFAFTIPVSA